MPMTRNRIPWTVDKSGAGLEIRPAGSIHAIAILPNDAEEEARLMAAAPELLKALQVFVNYMEHAGEKTIVTKTLAYPLHLAEGAIAKATGAGEVEP